MDNYFAREAEIMDIVYDLERDKFRIFTFDHLTKLSCLHVKLLFSMSL